MTDYERGICKHVSSFFGDHSAYFTNIHRTPKQARDKLNEYIASCAEHYIRVMDLRIEKYGRNAGIEPEQRLKYEVSNYEIYHKYFAISGTSKEEVQKLLLLALKDAWDRWDRKFPEFERYQEDFGNHNPESPPESIYDPNDPQEQQQEQEQLNDLELDNKSVRSINNPQDENKNLEEENKSDVDFLDNKNKFNNININNKNVNLLESNILDDIGDTGFDNLSPHLLLPINLFEGFEKTGPTIYDGIEEGWRKEEPEAQDYEITGLNESEFKDFNEIHKVLNIFEQPSVDGGQPTAPEEVEFAEIFDDTLPVFGETAFVAGQLEDNNEEKSPHPLQNDPETEGFGEGFTKIAIV